MDDFPPRIWSLLLLSWMALHFGAATAETLTTEQGSASMDVEYLVVDSSPINGEVALIRLGAPDSARIIPIAREATFFNAVSTGWFVYRDKHGNWWHGNLAQPGRVRTIDAVRDASYVAPSPDGSRLAVVTQEQTNSRLLVVDLTSTKVVDVFAKPGIVAVPAWGPASDAVAFYFVPMDLLLDDAFTLELVILNEAEAKTRTLAPPSGYTGLTAARTEPPRWSPDGLRILFSANYEASGRIEALAYTVARDGGKVERVEGGAWDSNGQALLRVRRKSLPFGDFVLSKYSLSSQASVDMNLPFALPKSVANGCWKPDGTRFAYVSNEGDLLSIGLKEKRQHFVARVPEGARLSWVNLTPPTSPMADPD